MTGLALRLPSRRSELTARTLAGVRRLLISVILPCLVLIQAVDHVAAQTPSSGNASDADMPGRIRFQKRTEAFGIDEGTTAQYVVRLLTAPANDVTLSLSQVDSQLRPITTQLMFAARNWSHAQDVSLHAVDDTIIQLSPYGGVVEVSSDSAAANFNSSNPLGVQTTNLTFLLIETDQANVIITRANVDPSPANIPEGRSGYYDVVLSSRPKRPVLVQFASQDLALLNVAPSLLLFAPDRWNISQRLTVTGVDDQLDRTSPYPAQFSLLLSSADTDYHNLSVPNYQVSFEDNDNDQSVIHGSLSWSKLAAVSRTTAVLRVEMTVDLPALTRQRSVGDNITLLDTRLSFGDGSADIFPLTLPVVSMHEELGYLVLRREFVYTYRTANDMARPWVASVDHCCRRLTLRNNANTRMLLRAQLDLSNDGSPALPTLAVFPMSIGSGVSQPQAVLLPGIAPDGHPVSWSLANSASYGSVQAGTPQGVSLDQSSGRLSWNTSGVAAGDYSVLVHGIDFISGAESTVEIVLRLTDPSSTPDSATIASIDIPSAISPPAGIVHATVGNTTVLNVTVVLSNNSLENASLVASGPLPAGLSIGSLDTVFTTIMDADGNFSSAPSLTALAQLSWTPTAGQVGRHVVCVVATDTGSTRTSPVASAPACYGILVHVAAVTQAPLVDLNGAVDAGLDFVSAFYKGTTTQAPVADTMEALVTSSRQVQFMTLRLIGNQDGASEQFAIAPGYFNPSVAHRQATNGLVFSGLAGAMEYSLALRNVRYANAKATPTLGSRQVIVKVFDETGIASSFFGAVATTTVSVLITNQVPMVWIDTGAKTTYATRFFPGLSPILITNPNATVVSDADSPFLTSTTVRITNIQDDGDEHLAATYRSPERLSLPTAYQVSNLGLSFGRQWLPSDRARAARRPSGAEVPTVNASLTVGDAFTVGRVDVVVDVSHSWLGDVELVLEHAGRRQTLVSRPGGPTCNQDDMVHTVFSQGASAGAALSATATQPGLCAPQTRGVFSADGDLAVFNGTEAGGEWTLYASDRSILEDNGMLTGFGLLLQPQETHLVDVVEPLQPSQRLGNGVRELSHQLLVSGSGGRILDLHVRLFLQATFRNRDNRLLPSVALRHPDGTQVSLLNCSSTACNNGTDDYNFLLFADAAPAAVSSRLQGSCCAAAEDIFTMATTMPMFSVGNDTADPLSASDCSNASETVNDLIDVFRPVEPLSTLRGKPMDGTWTLVVTLPDQSCADNQEVVLYGWGLQASREPNIDSAYNATSGELRLTGLDTTDNYEKVLRGVTYRNGNSAAEFTVVRVLNITASDGFAMSVTATPSITIHHIDIDLNPSRTVGMPTAPHYATTFVEETAPISVANNASATLRDASPGAAPMYVLMATIDGPMNGAAEGLSVTAALPADLMAEYSMDNTTVTVSSPTNTSYPIWTFEAVLRSILYYNAAEELLGRERRVDVSVQDTARSGQFYSLLARSSITLVHTNDAPVLDVNGDFEPLGSISNVVEYREGQGALALSNISGVVLYDFDNVSLSSVAVTISPLPDTSQYEIISADLSLLPNISMWQNQSGQAELLLFGVDTVENYREAIATVTYTNLRHGDIIGRPSTVPRRISFTVNDGLRDSTPAVVMVTFAAVNDRPLLDLNGPLAGIDFHTRHTEERGPVLINSDLTVYDVDNVTLRHVTVTVDNLLDLGSEFLSVSSAITTNVPVDSTGKVQRVTTLRPVVEYNESAGVLTVSGLDTVMEFEQVMRTLRYDNMADEPTPMQRRITVTASDGLLTSPVAVATVDIVLVNDSPYLNGAFIAETNITEDVTTQENVGTLVSFFGGLIDDDDVNSARGIAIVAVDNDNGQWEVTVDGGATWQSVDSNTSSAMAVVLRSDSDNAVRYSPMPDFNGEVRMSILAWDATSPSAADGSVVDASVMSSINAFSNNTQEFIINVLPVNDAPVMRPATVSLATITEDNYESVGDSVASLLATTSDVDLTTTGVDRELGIAILAVDEINGTWQYSQDGGRSWLTIGNVTNTSALLIPQRPSSLNRLRFVPNRDMNGQATVRYMAWDLALSAPEVPGGVLPGSALPAVTMVDTTGSDPVTGEFSVESNAAVITVQPVNDSPLLSANVVFQNFTEDLDGTINHGTSVADIVSRAYADVDFDFVMGVAVTGVDNTNGRFQHTCNRTSLLQWSEFVGDLVFGQAVPPLPMRSRSTLLAAHCRVRFVPNENFNTEFDTMHVPRSVADTPTVNLLAWDRTGYTANFTGRYGVDASATGPCVSGPFSCVEHTMSVHIQTVNDIPVLMLNGSGAENYEATLVEDTLGVPVVGADLTLIDVDHALLRSVTIIVHNATVLSNLQNLTLDYSNSVANDTQSADPICTGEAERREELLVDLSNTQLVATVRSYCPYVLELGSGGGGVGAPVAQYQHALRTLRYNNSLEEPSDQDRLVVFSVYDGIDRGAVRYTLLHTLPVNDAPSLDLNGDGTDLNYFVSYTEGDGAVPIVNVSAMRIEDHDNEGLQWARIELVDAPDAHNEHINVTIPALISLNAEFIVENNTLLLTGSASLTDYELVLQTATYINTEYRTGFPSDLDRRVDFVVSDGATESGVASTFISFTRVNDRPFLDLNGDTPGQDYVQWFFEERGPVPVCDPGLEIVDIDNVTLDSITVRIADIQDGASEVLAISNLVDSQVLSRDAFSQQRVVQNTHLTPNVTYDAVRGVMVIRGLANLDEYRRILATLTYNNVRDEPFRLYMNLTRQIVITLNDGLLDSISRSSIMNIVLINDSPVLSSTGVLIQPVVNEDMSSIANSGFSVLSMADSLISDDDDIFNPAPRKGVAVVAVNNTFGQWQYSTNLNPAFRDINSLTSRAMALHLHSTRASVLRFVPRRDYNGPTTLEFVAWDRSNGYSDGDITNATSINVTDAYSPNSRVLELTVVPVNDAPLINSLATVTLSSINEDDRNTSGDPVSVLLGAWSDDIDVVLPERRGVAITDVATANGYWEFSVNAGVSWWQFGTVNASSAVVLWNTPALDNRVRFVPAQDFNGQVRLTFKVWDRNSTQTSGARFVNTNTDVVSGPFSTGVAMASLTVDPVNDSPRLRGNMELGSIDEDTVFNVGDFVSTLVSSVWEDIEDGINQRGLAVTGVFNGPSRSYGEWQYTCLFGSQLTWEAFKGDVTYGVVHPRDPLPERATLLGPNCRVRFNPVVDYNSQFDETGAARPQSERPCLSVKAWDLTSGVMNTFGVNTITAPYDHTDPYSLNITQACISVVSQIDRPVVMLGGDTVTYSTAFDEPVPRARTVIPVLVTSPTMSLADADNASLASITVQMSAPDTNVLERLRLNTTGLGLSVTDTSTSVTVINLQIRPAAAGVASAPIGQFQAALRTMTYENGAEEPSAVDRTLTYTVRDGTSFTRVVGTVTIRLANDPPELDLDTAMAGDDSVISYTEGDGAVTLLAAPFTLVDHDSPVLQSASVAIRQAYDGEFEVLSAETASTAISAVYNGSTLMLTGPDTVSNFRSVLASVTYLHNNTMPGNPDLSTRFVDFSVSDGQNSSWLASTMVTFTAVNDRPFLDVNGNQSGVDYTVQMREQQGPVLVASPDAFIIDVDNATLAWATVRITNLLDGVYESLRVSNVRDYSDDITARMLTVTNIYPMQVYDNSTGTLTISGLDTTAEYQKVLCTARYNNVKDEPNLQSRRIEFVLSDGLLNSTPVYTTVVLAGINDSPYFRSRVAVIEPRIAEDVVDAQNPGVSVEELLRPIVGDDDGGDQRGLAVVGVDVSSGVWQYTLDYTENLTALFNMSDSNATDVSNVTEFQATWRNVSGATVPSAAVVLRAGGERIRVRFLPTRDFNGATTMTFAAWDATNNLADSSITDARDTGLLDPYSNVTRTMTLVVDPVNDAPVMVIRQFNLSTLLEDNRQSYGDTIATLVTGALDVDTGAAQEFGVAMVSVDESNGYWEVTVDDGVSWTRLANISSTWATVMRSRPDRQQRVRFSPALDFHGRAHFSFVLWDLTDGAASGSEGQDVLGADRVIGPFSVLMANASITVDPVNDSPVLALGPQLHTILEDDRQNNGTQVLDIGRGVYVDVDFDSMTGLAVVGVDNRFGSWQYVCPGSTAAANWTTFIGDLQYGVVVPPNPRPEKATLLAGDCRVRFLPILNFNTLRDLDGDLRPAADLPFVTVRGWDGTGRSAGRSGWYGQDTTYNNDSHLNEFSASTRMATVQITSVNDHPVLSLQSSGPLRFRANFVEDSAFVRVVNPAQLNLTDEDHSRMEQVTVTIARIYDVSNETLTLRPLGVSVVTFNEAVGLATVRINPGFSEQLSVTFAQVAVRAEPTATNASAGNNTAADDVSGMGSGDANATTNATSTSANASASMLGEVLYYRGVLVIRSSTSSRVSKASYIAVLSSLVYINSNSEPNNTDRQIQFAVDDSEVVVRDAVATVTVTLVVDNAPLLSLADTQLMYVENQPTPVLDLAPGMTLYDYDHNVFYGMASATAVLAPGPQSPNETLSVAASNLNGSNITARFSQASGVLDLFGVDSVATYESVLQSLMYSNTETEPQPLNRTITVQIFDTAGLRSNEIDISIDLMLINDRVPVITVPAPFSVIEHPKNATLIGSGLLLSDADSGDFQQEQISIAITNGVDGSSEVIRVTDIPPTINVTESLYALELLGPASVEDFNRVLASLTYINTAEEPGPDVRLISVEAFDGSFNSTVEFVRVSINLTNDLPVLDINGPQVPGFNLMINYEEGAGPVNIVTKQTANDTGLDGGSGSLSDSNFTMPSSVLALSDNDHAEFQYAIVQLGEVPDAPNELLNASTEGTNITASYDPVSGRLLLNGTDSLARYQSVLRTVTYQHLESDPGFPDTTARNVTFTINDGTQSSVPVWSLVTFDGVNDAPILDLNPSNALTTSYNARFVEEQGPVYAVDRQAMLEDIDSPVLSSLTITIANLRDVGYEFLSFNMTPAVRAAFSSAAVAYEPLTGNLTVSGMASVADYQALLRTLQYDNTRDEPDFTDRVIRVVANDGELDSLFVFSIVSMVPVNDPPRLNVTADIGGVYMTNFTEGDPPVAVVSATGLLVEDDDDRFLTQLSVRLYGILDPGYEAVFVDGTALAVASPAAVSARIGCPPPGTGATSLQLSTNLSIAEWTDVLRAIRYCSDDQHPISGVRNLTLQLADPSGARSRLRTTQIAVGHVNDVPYLNVTDGIPTLVTLIEDTNATIPILFAYTDHEETLTGHAIRVVQQPSPSRVVVNVTTGSLHFVPFLDDIGNRTAVFEICDSDGGCSEPYSITFALIPSNDPPRPVEPLTLLLFEDQAAVINISNYFSDAEDDLLDNGFPRVPVTSISGASKFTYTLNGLELAIRPHPNDNGVDQLNFEVCDSVGLCTPISVAVTIVAVNDPPLAETNVNPVRTFSTNEDTPVLIPIEVGDLEDRAFLPVSVVAAGRGTAAPNTSLLTNRVRTADNIYIQSMHLLFTPEKNYHGDAAFVEYAVQDSDGGNDTARINITVFYDNDAPVFNLQSLTTPEDTVLTVTLPAALGVTDIEDTVYPNNITLLSSASNGTVTYDPNTGTLTYVPHLNFFSRAVSDVVFTLQTCDTNAINPAGHLCTTANITVDVTSVNDIPLAPALELTVNEEASGAIDLYSFLFDVEDGKPPIGNVSLDLSSTAKGMAVYNTTTGLLVYTTSPGAFGGDTVLYTVCDSESACNRSGVITVTISAFNDPPFADNFTHVTREDDFDLVAIYEHIHDNDTRSTRDDLLAELRIQLVVPASGAYASLHTSTRLGVLRVYQSHGIITYQAPMNYVGHDDFRYSVCDRCDPRRNAELGRTSVQDASCLRQLDVNGGAYNTSATSSVYITCSEASVALLVGNINDVPVLRNISAVTTANLPVTLSPLTESVGVGDGMFASSAMAIYDRDDAQSINATRDSLNLALFNLSTATDVNVTHLVAKTQPLNGTATTQFDPVTGFAQLVYTPRVGTYGYDSFQYEVCDRINGTFKPAACTQASASIFVQTPGPNVVSVTAQGDLTTFTANPQQDSKFSRNDRIVVRFDVPTNMPPTGRAGTVFGTADVDQLIRFAEPFINPVTVTERYRAQWADRETLHIDIIDEGYPQPNITYRTWQLGITGGISPCNGFNPATQQPYTSAERSRYCLLTADGLSLHTQQDSSTLPRLQGTFGDVLPTVTSVIRRNDGVEPSGTGGNEQVPSTYFGTGSEIFVYLQPPLSAPQLEELCWQPTLDIFQYNRADTLGVGTQLGLSSCANQLEDGSNAANMVQPTPGTELPRLGAGARARREAAAVEDDVIRRDKRQALAGTSQQPTVSQIILLVHSYEGGPNPVTDPTVFSAAVRAALNVNLLRQVVFRNTSVTGVVVEPAVLPVLYAHSAISTPLVTSFVASDPDNSDSVLSVGDVFTVTFDRPTNTPMVGLKKYLDKIFNFSTPLARDYVGSWTSTTSLRITVTDVDGTLTGSALPRIGALTFQFTSTYLSTGAVSTSNEIPFGQLNCIGINVCGGNETSRSIGVCSAGGSSCRATGLGPTLSGDFGTGAGPPATQSLWWIALIVVLFVFVVVVVAYAVHRHHKQAKFKREALGWISRWQVDKKNMDKPSANNNKPASPHEEWARPTAVEKMQKRKDPFENLPEGGGSRRPSGTGADPFSNLPTVSDAAGRPVGPSRQPSIVDFQPRRPASIADVDGPFGAGLDRQVLPPLKRASEVGLPVSGAPLNLPPLKPLPRQPSLGIGGMGGIMGPMGPRKLAPLSGPAYDINSLPSGSTRPSLPPLKGDPLPPVQNLPVGVGPLPPVTDGKSTSPTRRPSRKRVMKEMIDSQSSGMFENLTATDTQTGESATATAESEGNSGGSDPALLTETSNGEAEGPPPPRQQPAPRPLISPRDRRTTVGSPEGLGPRASIAGGINAPPRSMRRPSQSDDPFSGSRLSRQLSQLSRQGSQDAFQLPSSPPPMTRPMSRQNTGTSLLGQTGRVLPRGTSRSSVTGPPGSPPGRVFAPQATGQFAAPPRTTSTASNIGTRFPFAQRPPPPGGNNPDGQGDDAE